MNALRQGLSRRHALVVAEAGYGKTTLLAQFARSVDWPVAWYTVTETGQDPAAFLASVAAAVDAGRPGTAFTAGQVLRSPGNPAEGWQAAADALINDLAAAAPDPTLIVLDDVHLVADSPSARIPGYLAYHAPQNVHLALASRTRPVSPELARLAGQGEIFALDSHDLAFTPEEVAALLAGISATPLSPEEVAMAHAQTEGWAVGLQLLRQAIRSGGWSTTREAARSLGRGRHELYEFFSTQALDRLPVHLRRFLLQVSILDVIEPAICEAITGTPDAPRLLRRLEERGLFLMPLEPDKERYRFHRLFRETVRGCLEREAEAGEIRRVQREAGRFLARHGRAAEAVPHLLAAGEFPEVTALLAAEGERWLQEGSGSAIAGWIAALPRDMVEASASLLTLLGRLADRRGDWHQALAHYAGAAALATGDAAGVARYCQASALFRLHRFAEARQICEEGLTTEGLTAATRARLIRGKASCDLWSGAPAGVIPLLEEALALLRRAGNLHDQVLALRELAFVRREIQPEPGWPAQLLPLVLQLHHQAQHLLMRVDAAQLVGDLLCEQGEYLRALEILEEAGTGARLLGDVFRTGLYLLRRGLALLGLGRHEEARDTFQNGMRLADEHRADQSGLGYTLGLALLARREGQPTEAVRLFRENLEACHRQNVGLLVPSGRVHLALAAAEAGGIEEARTHLQEAIGQFLAWGAQRRAAECALHLAALEARGVAPRTVGLAQALRAARELNLQAFFSEHADAAEALLARALLEGVEVEYVSDLLAARGDVRPAAPALAHPEPAARLRAIEVLARIGGEEAREHLGLLTKDPSHSVRMRARQAMATLNAQPPAPLFVRLLGGFDVCRGAVLMSPDVWRRRRHRLLFACLVVAGGPVSRDHLVDALWPDLSASSAGTSLNAAWSHLKRALEPGLPEGRPSTYLLQHRGHYSLRWPSITTDVQQFEHCVTLADRAESVQVRLAHLEMAAALYRGDLLAEDANEPWASVERERLRALHLSALERLADAQVEMGRLHEAAETLRTVLRLESWREESYRRLMRVLAALGRRSEALHTYRQCEALLRRELGVPPEFETTALFQAIAQGRFV